MALRVTMGREDSNVTDNFARAVAACYGGLDEPGPERGTLYLSANGIQFVYGKSVNNSVASWGRRSR